MFRQEVGIFAPYEYPFSDGASSSPKDTLVSPELIEGHPYRIPSIIRPKGKGDYDFEDLVLPEGWQDVRDDIAGLNWDRQRMIFNARCIDNNAIPLDVIVDEKGLLRQVQVGVDKKFGGGQASVTLTQDGEYRATGLDNIRMFVPLMGTVAGFLNQIKHLQKDERNISAIFKNRDAFGSADLQIPDTCFESQDPVTTPEYQEEFTVRAKEIGSQLGEEVKWSFFDEQGILKEISLSWGSACNYSFTGDGFGVNAYSPHNVDGPRSAIVLHSVAAAFVNDMLDAGHTYTPLGIYDRD